MIVLPGSKATLADMRAMRAQGWDIDILAHHRRGGMVLGLCGGYQMLGREIADPQGLEGPPGSVEGLGLLDVRTLLTPGKALARVTGTALGAGFDGYEMHVGQSEGPGAETPFARLDGDRPDGAVSPDGRVIGTYVHGLLNAAPLRRALLERIGVASAGGDHRIRVDEALEDIAGVLDAHLNIEGLIALAVA